MWTDVTVSVWTLLFRPKSFDHLPTTEYIKWLILHHKITVVSFLTSNLFFHISFCEITQLITRKWSCWEREHDCSQSRLHGIKAKNLYLKEITDYKERNYQEV